jgi:hypothetical protein
VAQESASPQADPINPSYYKTEGGIECIQALEAMGVAEDFCRANVVKYLWRVDGKGNPLQDARKAEWYLKRLIGYLEAKQQPQKAK